MLLRNTCMNHGYELLLKTKTEKYLEAVTKRCSVKKYILKYFLKFTEKHLCQNLVLNKVVV